VRTERGLRGQNVTGCGADPANTKEKKKQMRCVKRGNRRSHTVDGKKGASFTKENSPKDQSNAWQEGGGKSNLKSGEIEKWPWDAQWARIMSGEAQSGNEFV